MMMMNKPLGCSVVWNMYLRLVILLIVELVASSGQQASSDIPVPSNTSSATITWVENLLACHPNRTETCPAISEAHTYTSSSSSSSSFSSSSPSSSSPSSSSPSLSPIYRELLEMEIFQQNLRMDAMIEEMKQIWNRMLRFRPLPEPFSEYSLHGRVSALEGSGCGPDKVQCGARTRAQCLSDLFVCDGITDCINGRDEDPDICSEEPVKVGRTYSGFSFWQTCLSRRPHRSMIVLTHSRRHAAFKSRVHLNATLIHNVGDDILTQYMTGYFNFARRQIELMPVQATGQNQFGIQCLFNRGDHIHLDCKIVRPASFSKCGFLTMARI